MSKYRMRAAALLAAGAVAGGATAATLTANADDTGTGDSSPSADSRPGPGGPGGHGRGGTMLDTAALAKALGVTEARLTAAFEAVREDLKPDDAEKPADGEKRTPPTDEERADRQAALAKALAEELGIDESKVADALDTVRAAHEAERRTDLSDRLDDAVKDGDLTDADKASVLKAYDAGVLGGR